VSWVVFTSHSTYNKLFRRWVFPGNHLHWYWQLKPNEKIHQKQKPQNKPALGKKNTQKPLNQTCTYISSWMYKPFNSFCPCTCILFRYSIYRMTYSLTIYATVHCLHYIHDTFVYLRRYGACNRNGTVFSGEGRGEKCFLHGQTYSILGWQQTLGLGKVLDVGSVCPPTDRSCAATCIHNTFVDSFAVARLHVWNSLVEHSGTTRAYL